MPGFILHMGATVICAHGGQAMSPSPNPRVRVGGQPVVTQPVPFTIAGCAFVMGTVPSACCTARWVTGAVRVRVGVMPVLLQDSMATCVPNGTPLSILVTQVRVRGT